MRRGLMGVLLLLLAASLATAQVPNAGIMGVPTTGFVYCTIESGTGVCTPTAIASPVPAANGGTGIASYAVGEVFTLRE